ncbi:substrate-binding periplasmic protein [Roseibium sediminicola]|uniref:Transporter substrate-binding domain-containing protein n=1 Tax=Roseibium sediminicola TaxID=2933272 RepID=A0ABT0GMY4_9HYPH|nr:ABC transporter substrate-binding protein [Roseibium sp. CAU 1639]MCK7610787.1 transporter substrate-binding domain-containing protein [Roseibium sp. CAU 1639]
MRVKTDWSAHYSKTLGRRSARLAATMFGCLLAACLFAGSTAARDLVILATPEEPYKFVENGVYKGIDIEVIDEVMRRLDLTYSVELIESGTRIQQEAMSGRADMLLLFSKKPERMAFLLYPEESYIDISWNFFIRAEDEGKIAFEAYRDLAGLQIGITQDFSYTPEFLQSGLSFQTVPRNTLQIGMLLAKRIDAVPMNTISTLYEEKKAGRLDKLSFLSKPLITKPYYNVFAKASSYPDIDGLVARYDQTIRDMKADGTLEAILVKYLGKRHGGKVRSGS